MNILITGGAGFIGSNLALEFKNKDSDNQITSFDNLKRRGSELNIPRLLENKIKFIHGDIRNKEDFNNVSNKPETIIECSAEPSVTAGYNSSPDYVINTNLLGTINCLEYARKYDSNFIFLSTSRVYPTKTINNLNYNESLTRFELSDNQTVVGVSNNGITEDFPLNGCRTLYGATKLSSELILQEYIEMYGLKGIINRCGLITGSWQMGKIDQGVVVLWIAKHFYNEQLDYIGFGGKGKQVRDILHVKDLYNLLDIQIDDIKNHSGELYNVGGGLNNSLSLIELTELCQKYTHHKILIGNINENRKGDIRIFITDNSKVENMTDWKPKISINQIINDTTTWIRNNSNQLKNIIS